MNSETGLDVGREGSVAPGWYQSRHVLWSLAFRPFFLLGGLYAALVVLSWVSFFTKLPVMAWPGMPIYWHAHEMVFGVVLAVVIGFLLTASANWTGLPPIQGRRLQILVVLWLLARLILYFDFAWRLELVAVVNVALFPVLMIFLKPYLLIPTQKRNWIFMGLFALFLLGSLLFHLEQLQLTVATAWPGLYLGIYVVLSMITIIGGRVIPFFTGRAIQDARIQTNPKLDRLALVSTLAVAVTHLLVGVGPVFAVVCVGAALIHLFRYLKWDMIRSFRKPILWILYFGYLWLIVGFVLLAAAGWGWLTLSVAIHAMTAGAMGVLIYGMITRVALGHTGRPIEAPRTIVFGYVLINLAALFRVAGPIISPSAYIPVVLISGLFWTVAFGLFVVVYTPILTRPRL